MCLRHSLQSRTIVSVTYGVGVHDRGGAIALLGEHALSEDETFRKPSRFKFLTAATLDGLDKKGFML